MKAKKTVPYSIRQGDVLLVEASYRGEKSGKDVTPEDRVVLAHGEVTGHAHAIKEVTKARYFDADAERFLQVIEKVALKHEEHSAVFLAPDDRAGGKYQQAFQCEDYGVEVRRVAD